MKKENPKKKNKYNRFDEMIIRSSVVELLCSCEERRACVGFNIVSGYTPLVEVNQAIFAW